jgi:hypothetical protein
MILTIFDCNVWSVREQQPGCGRHNDGDVWFKVVLVEEWKDWNANERNHTEWDDGQLSSTSSPRKQIMIELSPERSP